MGRLILCLTPQSLTGTNRPSGAKTGQYFFTSIVSLYATLLGRWLTLSVSRSNFPWRASSNWWLNVGSMSSRAGAGCFRLRNTWPPVWLWRSVSNSSDRSGYPRSSMNTFWGRLLRLAFGATRMVPLFFGCCSELRIMRVLITVHLIAVLDHGQTKCANEIVRISVGSCCYYNIRS